MTKQETIEEITRRLVDFYHPGRIYLFGSEARGDAGAKLLLHPGEPEPSRSLFHSQQAAEKSAKAFLASRDVSFRRTHDLTLTKRFAHWKLQRNSTWKCEPAWRPPEAFELR